MRYQDYQGDHFVGIDVGDKDSVLSYLDRSTGEIVEATIRTTPSVFSSFFKKMPPAVIAFEVGSHSLWMEKLLRLRGHMTIVANPRQLKLISQSLRKNDRRDAELLMSFAEKNPELLNPIEHRPVEVQMDMAVIKTRNGLISARTKLSNQIHGMIKQFGLRFPKSVSSGTLFKHAEKFPDPLRTAIVPLINAIEFMTQEIRKLDKEIEQVAKDRYPTVDQLRKIPGIGPITALAFVLTIDNPKRFTRSRTVGAYLGLVPKQRESGEMSPQLGITKTGNSYLRSLLVNCAQRMLGKLGDDCEIRRWGLVRAQRGGANAKKRAVVGVARKLAVVMHRMWMSGEDYNPNNRSRVTQTKAA